jgi:hypothetical protein
MKSSRQKLTLDSPRVYEIRVPGELDESWADWDGKMTVTVDQAAPHSLLRRLYALGLPLISVICVGCGADD